MYIVEEALYIKSMFKDLKDLVRSFQGRLYNLTSFQDIRNNLYLRVEVKLYYVNTKIAESITLVYVYSSSNYL